MLGSKISLPVMHASHQTRSHLILQVTDFAEFLPFSLSSKAILLPSTGTHVRMSSTGHKEIREILFLILPFSTQPSVTLSWFFFSSLPCLGIPHAWVYAPSLFQSLATTSSLTSAPDVLPGYFQTFTELVSFSTEGVQNLKNRQQLFLSTKHPFTRIKLL